MLIFILINVFLIILIFSLRVLKECYKLITPRYIDYLIDENKKYSPYLNKISLKNEKLSYLYSFFISFFSVVFYYVLWKKIFDSTIFFFDSMLIIVLVFLTFFINKYLVDKALDLLQPRITNSFAFLTWQFYRIFHFIPDLISYFLVKKSENNKNIEKSISSENQKFEIKLLELVNEANEDGFVESDEKEMIESIINLNNTVAKEIMVPRSEVTFIDKNSSVQDTLSLMVKSGFSRIPVVENDFDDTLGIVYLKDIVKRQFLEKNSDFSVAEIMKEPHFLPVTVHLSKILDSMRSRNNHMVLLVDEYGGVAGLLTIEDILEEIVGEIRDEFDKKEEDPIHKLNTNLFRVAARLSINELNRFFNLHIAEDDVDTVAGLLTLALERIPVPGAKAKIHGLFLFAEGSTQNEESERITSILVAKDDGSMSLGSWFPFNEIENV